MRLQNCIALATLLAATCGHAAVSAYDPYLTGANPGDGEYTLGNVGDQNPTVLGYTGAWINNSANSPQVSATGLSYSNSSGTLNVAGGSIATVNTLTRSGRVLSAPVTSGTNTTLYMSVLLQLESVGGGDYRSFEIQDGGFDDNTQRRLQIGHGGATDFLNSGTNYGLRLFSNDSFRLDLGAADTNVNLFVLKFVLSDQGNGDSITVWRNPDMGGAEPGTNNGTLSGFNLTFDRTSLARFGGDGTSTTDIASDEIRFGDSFASVTPIPEPSAVLLGAIGSLILLRRRK